MKNTFKKAVVVFSTISAIIFANQTFAQSKLTVYCGAEETVCQLLKTEFEKDTGISVAMTRKSAGETYAQIKAEASNPKGDVWWGGTGDPHMQAAEDNLTEAYISPMRIKLAKWAIDQATAAKDRTVGIYSGALGFGYNTEMLKAAKLPEPKCWKDLIKPEYKGKIQMANPNSSGTAYTTLATIVQLFGEDAGFDYMKALHKNINQYTKSGSAPIKAAARGETLIGIVFLHDAVAQAVEGFPVKAVAPCEGTGFEIGSVSLIKGAKNKDNAKLFIDYVLNTNFQSKMQDVKSYQVPSNINAKVSPLAPKFSEIKFINYDFVKYGASAERTRLLKKWDTEVSTLPQ